MINFEKHIKTRNPALRFVGNVSGSISTYFLMREIRSEDKNNNSRARLYARLYRIFEKPQNKWGTYYTSDIKSVRGRQEWTVPRSYKNTLL